ncbi:phage tail protein [Pantoea vagans]|uniref:phage tail protein n=1 Tax=Pantoea vagans TaxID=470934 RepID=UPI001093C062|nr:phage tail protein [Pantoea vagans]QCA04858.1 hypothetical protein EGO56_12130 [Pantoea vagans]
MAEQYYSILTNRGKELEAASSASGTPVIIKDFVIGDGNGMAVTPDPTRTVLVREVYRQAISNLDVSKEQANQWVAHLVIPADVGGFTIREVGLLTDAGELYAVANCAAIEKPISGINVNLQFRLAVNETANIELQVATGDGLFLRQDANLSDLKDKGTAKKNLSLEKVGNFQAVQQGGAAGMLDNKTYMGWSGEAILAQVDDTPMGALYYENNPPPYPVTSVNKKTGALSLDKSDIGLGDVGNWLAVQANGGKHSSGEHHYYVDWNDGLYMTVDDTDLGRVFTESHPPTAAQTGAYPLSGGYLNDEASITVISTVKDGTAGQGIYSPMYRATIRGRGGDMDFGDGASACFRLVEVVSNYAFAEVLVDGYGGVTSYQFRNDGSFRAPGYLYAGGAFVAPDANLYGSVWGGYLNQWVLAQDNALNVALNTQITNLNNSISAQLNNMNADRTNCVRATARGGRQHKVGGDWIADWEAPAGCFMTGMNTNEGGDGRKAGLYYRALYYYTNASGWVQAGDIA